MSADVTFILGRAGSGKSRRLTEYAAGLAKAGRRAYYIVPEQFTFETERALCERLGGLIDIKVCSFTTLAEKTLRETGERRVFLTRQGRRMVIRKCAEDNAARLTAFAGVFEKPGFTDECDAFFTLCKRFNIDPDTLRAATGGLGEHTPLRAKLDDLSLIYTAAEAHLAGRQMDAEDAFTALKERLPKSSVRGAEILIDGFDLISEQLYDIIGALMDISPHITIALRADASPRSRDEAVFAAESRVLARVKAAALERAKQCEYIYLPDKNAPVSRYASPALAWLEHEGFAYPFKPYEGKSDGAIRLFAGTDVRAEAEAVADAVLAAADAGVRYRDMAIIATDMDKYIEPVGRALRRRGIPFFTDAKHPLSSYPAAVLALSALRAAAHGFPAREMLKIAKCGFSGVEDEQAEAFENYLAAHSVRGDGFMKPFNVTDGGAAATRAEAAREALAAPLAALRRGLSAAHSAADKAAALYAYLDSIGLRSRLVALTDSLRAQGELELMEENAQVFNMMLELISQLYAIMGDAPISTARFINIFEEGLSSYEVGSIPTTADQLLFGSLGRSRARDLEALFVLGASQGLFPANIGDDGMIDDEDIATLVRAGLQELPNTGKRAEKELSDVYGAVTKPSKLLYLSWPISGKDNAPCALVDRIRALFGDVTIESDIAPGECVSAQSALERLAAGLREGVDTGAVAEEIGELYSAFASRPKEEGWDGRLENIERALYHSVSPEPFGRELAAALYGAPMRGSVSRLQTFNTCPFRHLAQYGLKLTPRREYRERKADEGTFCHDALCAFTKLIMECGKAPGAISDGEVDTMLAQILPELAAEHNGGVLLDSARGRALYARLVRKIRATALAVRDQLAVGSFKPAGCEVPFGAGNAFPAIIMELPGGARYELSGFIDRIDSYTSEAGREYFRVVDYKTGSTDFPLGDIIEGLKLQLPLYICAVTAVLRAEEESGRAAAGMYYQGVQEPVVKDNVKSIKQALCDQFRMQGISVRDAELLRAGGAGMAIPGERSAANVSRAAFRATANAALDKAGSTAEAIACGEAATLPIRRADGGTPCSYCDYSSVCGFDPALSGCAYRSVRRMKTADFLEEVQRDAKLD